MKLKDAEDLFLTCLCEATAFVDHAAISDRHLTPRSKRVYKTIVMLRNEGWSVIPIRTLSERSGIDMIDLAGIEKRVGKVEPEGTIKMAEQVVLEGWQKYQLANLYKEASAMVAEKGVEETQKHIVHRTAELQIESLGDDSWKTPLEWANRYLNELVAKLERSDATTAVVHSDFPAIDMVTQHYAPGRMTIIGALTSNGKSTLAAQILLSMAMRQTPVAIISLEDHPSIYTTRMLQWLATDVDRVMKLNNPNYTASDVNFVRAIAAKVFHQLPLYMDWIPSANVSKVCRRIQDAVRKFGCRSVMVDYIQCVRGGQDKKSGDGKRRIIIMDAASEMKSAAGEVGAHLILTSQLNTRDPKVRPTKANLKECGDLEEMAEYIGLLHREQNTMAGSTSFKARADVDLIIDKNKTGECGVIPLEFDRARACFITRTERD